MRMFIVAVGRLRPPFQDDVQHYRKMLGRYAKVESIELRDEEKVAGRIPDGAYLVLLDSGGGGLGGRSLGITRRMRGCCLLLLLVSRLGLLPRSWARRLVSLWVPPSRRSTLPGLGS